MSGIDVRGTPKLGFGLMRLPKLQDGSIDVQQTSRMTDMFLASGFTYFDTAYIYNGSEEAAGKALVSRYPRDSYTLASKLNVRVPHSEEEAKNELPTSLRRTGAGYFDYYLLHALDEDVLPLLDEYRLWDYVKEMRDRGRIRHWGFSFHDSPEVLEKILREHPDAEFVQLQINYADWENPLVLSRRCYETARSRDKPVVVMEPVKGGRIAQPPREVQDIFRSVRPDASFASWGIRFAASLDGILTVLSGMSDVAQMEDNTSVMKRFQPLSAREQEAVRAAMEVFAKTRTIPCTACRYCAPGCPMGIPIPDIFAAMNVCLGGGSRRSAEEAYEKATAHAAKASACVRCGQCESACPQHIPVIRRLRECAFALE